MKIVISDVSVRLQDRLILDHLNVTLSEKRIGLIGDNGSGKSTFARLLNGLIVPDEGVVSINGLNTKEDGADVRAQVGFLFQNPDSQIVMPTVAEDLELGLKPFKLDKSVRQKRVAEALDRFGLTHLATRSAHLLSGGEKQLVALAGAVISEPQLLICDEPTTLLDRRNAASIIEKISALDSHVVLVTHTLDLVRDFDRVLWLANGRIEKDGTPTEVIDAYMASFS